MLTEIRIKSGFLVIMILTLTTIWGLQVALSAFNEDADPDVLNHPILNLIFYMVTISIIIIEFYC